MRIVVALALPMAVRANEQCHPQRQTLCEQTSKKPKGSETNPAVDVLFGYTGR